MKKFICTFVLAVAFSASAAATTASDVCDEAGKTAKIYLAASKTGINPYAKLTADPGAMYERFGPETYMVLLLVAQDVWENRKTYSPKKAYIRGYSFCMTVVE